MEFFTIGVYNSSQNDFFDKLVKNQIDTFLDIRQRRGVRGSKYSFVNSNRLQHLLKELNINYGYIDKLAPTTAIRELQKKIDDEKGQLKSQREQLGQIFVIEYKNQILKKFDFDNFLETLDRNGASRIALFCVEEYPEACHRSIVSERLQNTYHYPVTHL